MGRSTLILISEDQDQTQRVRAFGHSLGCEVKVFTTSEWREGLEDLSFRAQVGGQVPTLATGTSPVEEGAKILPFPSHRIDQGINSHQDNKKVQTMNELESVAIENAIFEFNGNLTEAAKALGIGRATLYRKVKQYNINPSVARKKRAA